MAKIRLAVFDFDGTLLGRQDEFPLYAAFRDRLLELKKTQNTIWAVSTGRGPKSFWSCFGAMGAVGLEPDYTVTRHAYISGHSKFGYRPHIAWNLRTYYLLWVNRMRIRLAMNDWRKMITHGIRGSHVVTKQKDRLCLRFDRQEGADVAAELLSEQTRKHRHIMVFKYLTELDIRSVPYTKGLAASELARHLGVDAENVLAVGNGHNDISMLDPAVAGMVGCPLNSEAEVMEHVHRRGGHISRQPSLAGVLDILDAAAKGETNSELPEWWTPSAGRRNPRPVQHRHRPRPKKPRYHIWLILGILYIVLVVFSSFNLLPFSQTIMRPIRAVTAMLAKLFSPFF